MLFLFTISELYTASSVTRNIPSGSATLSVTLSLMVIDVVWPCDVTHRPPMKTYSDIYLILFKFSSNLHREFYLLHHKTLIEFNYKNLIVFHDTNSNNHLLFSSLITLSKDILKLRITKILVFRYPLSRVIKRMVEQPLLVRTLLLLKNR